MLCLRNFTSHLIFDWFHARAVRICEKNPAVSEVLSVFFLLFCSVPFLPSGTEEVLQHRQSPHVLNVFLPEHQGHFVQYLGYILATFLLLIFIVVIIIVLTRRRKKRGTVLCLWISLPVKVFCYFINVLHNNFPLQNCVNFHLWQSWSMNWPEL